MESPSYARATAASTRRAALTQFRTKQPTEAPSAAERQLMLKGYIPIKPFDRSRPCPLATLPPELRSLIYQYTFGHRSLIIYRKRINGKYQYGRTLWPTVLRICRAIRFETARLFYTYTEFTATVYNLDFSIITDWAEKLPICHRAYLTRNRSLKVVINLPENPYQINYVGYMSASHLWKYCRRFGNIYSRPSWDHRTHFLHFCKLANWWLWCGKPIHKDIKWHYQVQTTLNVFFGPCEDRLMSMFLEECMCTVALPCVQKFWTRTREESMMKKEALNMMNELDELFIEKTQRKRWIEDDCTRWKKWMSATKDFVKRW